MKKGKYALLKFIKGAMFVSIVSAPAAGFAQQQPMRIEASSDERADAQSAKMQQILKLSDAQLVKVKDVNRKTSAKMEAVMKSDKDRPAKMEMMEKLTAERMTKLKPILDAKQYKQFSDAENERIQMMKSRMQNGAPPPPPNGNK